MDEGIQPTLASCFPIAEAFASAKLDARGYWRLHLRVRHESWSWSDASEEVYEGLTLLEMMDVLADTEYRRDVPQRTPGAGCSR